jgi:LPS O-antigen subunit length determinant protein (WzzB/FepE family)
MKKKHSNYNQIDFDLNVVINEIWINKILIIIFCFFGVLGGYLNYSKNTEGLYDQYISKIIIQKPSVQQFESYSVIFLKYGQGYYNSNINKEYEILFNKILFSKDIQTEFIKKNENEFKEFLSFLDKRNLTVKNYLDQNDYFGEMMEDQKGYVPNMIFLIHPKELNAEKFLEKYIYYVKEIAIGKLRTHLNSSINNLLQNYYDELKIANELELKNPLILNTLNATIPMNKESGSGRIVNQQKDLFYKGSKVLKMRIKSLEKVYVNLNLNKFEYNPILDRVGSPQSLPYETKGLYFYILKGVTLGLLLSLMIIFLKKFIRLKK